MQTQQDKPRYNFKYILSSDSNKGHALPIILLILLCLMAIIYLSIDYFTSHTQEKPVQYKSDEIPFQDNEEPLTTFETEPDTSTDEKAIEEV